MHGVDGARGHHLQNVYIACWTSTSTSTSTSPSISATVVAILPSVNLHINITINISYGNFSQLINTSASPSTSATFTSSSDHQLIRPSTSLSTSATVWSPSIPSEFLQMKLRNDACHRTNIRFTPPYKFSKAEPVWRQQEIWFFELLIAETQTLGSEKTRNMLTATVTAAKVNPIKEEEVTANTEPWSNPKEPKAKAKAKAKASVIPAKRRLVKSMIFDALVQLIASLCCSDGSKY